MAGAIEVKGAPNFYQSGEGVLKILPEKLQERNWTNGLLVHGNKSWEAAKPFLHDIELPVSYIRYNGDCTHQEAKHIADEAHHQKAQFIIGVGGGKALDTAKAAGYYADLPVILIPTLASNCSPWASLSVFYDEEGNFVEYVVFPQSAYMVLVEPDLLLTTPEPYLIAGIGDTIAKWYEADALTADMEEKPLAVEIALSAARICRDLLLQDGDSSVEALRAGKNSPAFMRVVESIMMAGGMVGGFGDEYGRIAGAHSIHNGLTRVAATHQQLHGNKVAYGILVQLVMEDKFDEIDMLLPHYRQLHLPICLADIGITDQVEEAIVTTAEAAVLPSESIHFMNVSSAEVVADAMRSLERYLADKKATI